VHQEIMGHKDQLDLWANRDKPVRAVTEEHRGPLEPMELLGHRGLKET
jgi:hypothetical protein